MVKIAIFRKLLFFPRRFLNNEVEVKVDLQIIEAIKIVDNFSFPPLFSIFFIIFLAKYAEKLLVMKMMCMMNLDRETAA